MKPVRIALILGPHRKLTKTEKINGISKYILGPIIFSARLHIGEDNGASAGDNGSHSPAVFLLLFFLLIFVALFLIFL